jgi:hypothetical protein
MSREKVNEIQLAQDMMRYLALVNIVFIKGEKFPSVAEATLSRQVSSASSTTLKLFLGTGT